MRGPRFAAALLVVATLLVGTQLAFTAVGQEVGPNWSEPAAVAKVESTPEHGVTGMAADGGDPGAVAWIERHDDEHVVHVARFTVRDGTVTVSDRREVGRADHELTGVSVAAASGRAVVVWESTATDRIMLARVTANGTETRVAADMHRLDRPSVAFAGDEPLVAWTGRTEPNAEQAVYAARPGGESVRVGGPTHHQHAPTATGGPDRAAVTWFETESDTVVLAHLAVEGTPNVTDATPVATAKRDGVFGGARRKVPYVASAANASTVRPVWTDDGTAATAPVVDGTVGPRTALQGGREHGIGAAGDRWVVAWSRPGGSTGLDIGYRTNTGASGTVARLPGEEHDPTPVFAPDPAIAWHSWGSADEVLVSAHRPPARNELRYRLETGAPRLLFVGVVSALLGVASLPVMPWSLAGLVGAFLVTSEPLLGRLSAGARRATSADIDALRERAGALPVAAWPVAFAAVEIPLTAWVLGRVSFGFGHAVGTGVAALAATLVVVRLLAVDSGWRATAVYVVLQNAALWTLAAPNFV